MWYKRSPYKSVNNKTPIKKYVPFISAASKKPKDYDELTT